VSVFTKDMHEAFNYKWHAVYVHVEYLEAKKKAIVDEFFKDLPTFFASFDSKQEDDCEGSV